MARFFAAMGGDRMIRRYLIRGYWPIYLIAALSIFGTLIFQSGKMNALFADRWSLAYLIITPFLHGSVLHVLCNILGLHYIGGQLLLPLIGARRFIGLFIVAILLAGVVNNLLSPIPAVGISAAVLAMLSCVVYPYGRLPMKFLLFHDVLRLPPFRLWTIVAFLVVLDICGIIFGWRVFAHWAHLCGFAVGGVAGLLFFGWRLKVRH